MSRGGFVDSVWHSHEDVLDDILKHAEYCVDWADYKNVPKPATLLSHASTSSVGREAPKDKDAEKLHSDSEKCDKSKDWFLESKGYDPRKTFGEMFIPPTQTLPTNKTSKGEGTVPTK